MKRAIYFLMSDEKKLNVEIKGFSDVVKRFYDNAVLATRDDMLVFMSQNNGYLITGGVYDGTNDFIHQYLGSYDVFQLVIDVSLFEQNGGKEALKSFCSNLLRLFGSHNVYRRLLLTITDINGTLDMSLASSENKSERSKVVFVVHPSLNDSSLWDENDVCSGSYNIGNVLWRTYVGRHSEIENMCFSQKRCDVFVGELLSRCFDLEEINSEFLGMSLS